MRVKSCLWSIVLFCVLCPFLAIASHQDVLRRSLHSLHLELENELTIVTLQGGVTNIAYKISGENLYFAKFAFDPDGLVGASLYREFEILKKIAPLKIAPRPVFFDPENDCLITDFVVGNGESVNLRDRVTLEQCCKQLKTLHLSDVEFSTAFCPFGELDKLLNNAREVKAEVPLFLVHLVEESIRQWDMDELLFITAPCHLDLHSRNLIQGDQLWMIDWEYAGRSNPWYDLAVFASGEKFTDDEMKNLLEVYEGDDSPSEALKNHFWKMRILADARWAFWSCIQEKISPLDCPFRELGEYYAGECEKRLPFVQAMP